VVEDEDSVRTVTVRILRANGYRPIEAPDPVRALEIMRQERSVDLLLTDVVMPQQSGLELAREARQLQPGLRAVFVSGYAQNLLADSAPTHHHARVLQKPFNAEQLLRHVREGLDAS
jgi:two-component system cell cycle sensor histidine kinase/response regulator CckA